MGTPNVEHCRQGEKPIRLAAEKQGSRVLAATGQACASRARPGLARLLAKAASPGPAQIEGEPRSCARNRGLRRILPRWVQETPREGPSVGPAGLHSGTRKAARSGWQSQTSNHATVPGDHEGRPSVWAPATLHKSQTL